MLKKIMPSTWSDWIKPLLLGAFLVYIAIKVPVFFSANNLVSVLSQGAVIGVASIGMTMVILAGEIDISVGGMA